LSGVVPSAKGNITVSCTIDADTSAITQELNSPINTVCIIGIPKQLTGKNVSFKSIKAGADIIWQNGLATGSVAGVAFFEEDNKYIKFKVQPGSWVFTSESVESSTGVNFPKNQGITVFPSYTDGVVKVQFAIGNKNASIQIVDMAGHTVYSKGKLSVKQGDVKQVDISAYTNGAYLLTVNDSYQQKIIKTDSLSK